MHLSSMHHQVPTSYPAPTSPNGSSGARLMALLDSKQQQPSANSNMSFPSSCPSTTSSTASPPPPTSSNHIGLSAPEFSNPTINPPMFPSAAQPVNFAASFRFPSSKFPRGRHLVGDRVVYDIDVRLKGESQPQLEVTPITKYISDPGLVLGRQIAVNKTYICYGLKLGSIRVLNINTALRSLLRGHTQVTFAIAHTNIKTKKLDSLQNVFSKIFVVHTEAHSFPCQVALGSIYNSESNSDSKVCVCIIT